MRLLRKDGLSGTGCLAASERTVRYPWVKRSHEVHGTIKFLPARHANPEIPLIQEAIVQSHLADRRKFRPEPT